MHESEVIRLRKQIACEYEAAYNGLHGLAVVGKAPHLHRTECTERIEKAHEQLVALLGPDDAIRVVAHTLNGLNREGSRINGTA